MSQEILDIHLSDTLTLIRFQFIQPTDDDPSAPFDLTGCDVEFKMVTKSGRIIVEQTDEGVTIEDAENGICTYALAAEAVDQAGDYPAYAVAIDGDGKTLHGPVKRHDFILRIHAD